MDSLYLANKEIIDKILAQLREIKGGYTYLGACSSQICFPLKAGGELRFMILDDDNPDFQIDLYEEKLPPMITGYAKPTGQAD